MWRVMCEQLCSFSYLPELARRCRSILTPPFRICMIGRINFNGRDDNLKAILPPVETISQTNWTAP